ncbi:hypothetical protein [Streptomyces beijiangensis]|uniref:Uncharacterized protein n=1 Tax=Streptomyces beijiangensis TaxID=163361 RepID=A0A939F5T9_9ACTN|nr:hypothetical protein [Streptomyces beijiangensis]MBO0512411.1 hypothetical protein [Streptomyces beijiangensis]
MEPARISITQGDRKYRYLWLKYVTGIDLSLHCARSLHGPYSKHVGPELRQMSTPLNERPTPIAWYLCGVTTDPSRWADNPHLAFEPAPGHTEELAVHGLAVTLTGARPIIGWGAHSIPAEAPNSHDRHYATCRNWQFAHHLHQAGTPDIRGVRPRGPGTRNVIGQLPLH